MVPYRPGRCGGGSVENDNANIKAIEHGLHKIQYKGLHKIQYGVVLPLECRGQSRSQKQTLPPVYSRPMGLAKSFSPEVEVQEVSINEGQLLCSISSVVFGWVTA